MNCCRRFALLTGRRRTAPPVTKSLGDVTLPQLGCDAGVFGLLTDDLESLA